MIIAIMHKLVTVNQTLLFIPHNSCKKDTDFMDGETEEQKG